VADEGAEARLGWLLLQIGQPQEALRSVDEALAINPDLDEARWFRANIQLYGLDDPAGAAVILQEMAGRDLDPELRQQVDRLLGTAQERIAGGAG
jgi:tetratricopeptide (TPR) repeat protein